MGKRIILMSSLLLSFCISSAQAISISKIEIHLSAFGVESDDFPSVEGYIDFTKRSSNCIRSYYNPDVKGSAFQLSQEEIRRVLELLQNSDLNKLKKEYSVKQSDQPTSTLIIFTNRGNYTIKDYGLRGDRPLPDVYKIVYKL